MWSVFLHDLPGKLVLSGDLLIDQMIQVLLGIYLHSPLPFHCEFYTSPKRIVASALLLVAASPWKLEGLLLPIRL
jgi:hypothetical protein